jgi:hypothetical protein
MIQIFIDFLKNHSYYFESELKDVQHTCCQSTIKVVDFDKVKDEFSKELGISYKLKSVDVLYLSKTTDTIYFIEMKRKDPTNTKVCAEFVRDRLHDLKPKLIDSLLIISSLIGYFQIDRAFYSFFLDPSKLKTKSILLTDISNQDLVTITLSQLHMLNINLGYRIGRPITTMNCDGFNSYFATI